MWDYLRAANQWEDSLQMIKTFLSLEKHGKAISDLKRGCDGPDIMVWGSEFYCFVRVTLIEE